MLVPRVGLSLTIEDVVNATLQTHPAIQSQLAQREASLVDVRTARQSFYPTPSVSLEQVNSSAADPSYGKQSTLQTYRLQQPLWTGGRITAGLDKAQANVQVADQNANDAKQQMAFRAVQAWTEWYLATLRVQAQKQSVDTHERLMSVVQRRVAEGAMAHSELSLTRSRLDQSLAQLEAFDAQQRVARLKVAQLMGRTLLKAETPEIRQPAAPCPSDAVLDRALTTSAALKKIKAQQEALDFEWKERQADLTPEIYLRLERAHIPTYMGQNMLNNDRVYVGLSSRLGPGLSNLTVLESLEKKRQALQSDYETAERSLIEAVQTEQEQLHSIATRQPFLRNALEASQQTAQAWDRQFLAGRRAWIEVMNAAREMAQAEIDWGDANASHIGAQWRISIYCGELQSVLMTDKPQLARGGRP